LRGSQFKNASYAKPLRNLNHLQETKLTTSTLSQIQKHDTFAALRLPEFRSLLVARLLGDGLASQMLAITLGYQVYRLGNPNSEDPTLGAYWLGIMGLIEAIPALSLALYGGYIADRNERRRLVLSTQTIMIICALLLAFQTFGGNTLGVWGVFGVIFIIGIARGFGSPASSAFDAQVVPRELQLNAASWTSSVWQIGAVGGPAVGGLALYWLGVGPTYLVIAGLVAIALFCISRIAPKPKPEFHADESIRESIVQGAKFVLHNQVLVGSMALDLFAVLFGGAMVMLPAFADLLGVGTVELGLMRAAPSAGALLVMLWSARHPPARSAGRNLLISVGAFGLCFITFALSRSLWLTLVTLALSGLFDGISMVIRGAIVRLMSPENMRGRIAAVSWIFIGASNELGALESGLAATAFGIVPSVVGGSIVTLLVVIATTFLAPKLRQLDLTHAMEQHRAN